MANEQNLVSIGDQTTEKQREITSKGGKKSGEVRRARKAMKEQAELLLSMTFDVKDKKGQGLVEQLKALGIPEEQIDNQMASLVALWKTTLFSGKNQVSAFQELRDLVGDKEEIKTTRVEIINDLPKDSDED